VDEYKGYQVAARKCGKRVTHSDEALRKAGDPENVGSDGGALRAVGVEKELRVLGTVVNEGELPSEIVG